MESLSPIQRAYLVGEQDGLELSGPARYYLACDLRLDRVPGIAARLARLVRDNDILRTSVRDLDVSTLSSESTVDVDIQRTDAFDAANEVVRRRFTAEEFAFGEWPQLEIAVVHSGEQARLHLVYALWLMDAASLGRFLAELVSDPVDVADAPPVVRRRSARDERFWRARAAELPDPAELPLRPDWRQAGPAVTHRLVTIDVPAADRIAKTAREHGLTPSMVYLAVYGLALGRLGGGVAHTITMLHSRRTGTRLGNCGSTMPVEIPASAGRFVDVAQAIQARCLSQAMHASLSGAQIARLGDPGGDPRRLPYPFAFTAFDVDGLAEAELGLRRRWDDVQLRVPQVLIDHQVVFEADGSVRLGFDWRSTAFDPGFVEDFVDQCVRLVHDLADSGESWTSLPERTPVPSRPVAAATGEALHHQVLRVAAERPESSAVHDVAGTMTYAELAAEADAVADALLGAGAQRGDRVAVHLPRGRGQVVGILGTLIAGCVYIPLEFSTPDGRLDAIARRADVRFAITDPGKEDGWVARGVSVPSAGPWRPRPEPCPTAYVIFTSGSTGEPKGVVISHAAAVNTIVAVNELLGLGPSDSVLSVSAIGFDLSVYDLFGPLVCGGSVVMLSERTARDPAAWAGLIERHGVTIWNSAPALASLLAEEGAAVPSLRTFMLSGDWIPLTLPDALVALAPGAEVVSLGGATEGAIWSIYHRVTAADRDGRSIPYGTPLAGQDILVLDAHRRECPDWHIGEIHIAGAGVADGYLNDSGKTAAAFFADPEFGWIYRTGDRGRRHPGGVVEFLGRTDTQVKINGHRVELGEIEHLLATSDAVAGCAVCVRGGRRVVAYVSLVPDAPGGWREDLSTALKNALPHYMVPDAIVELDRIPLTANGKLDRRALEALPLADAPEPVALPQDLHGHEVALCWEEVLGEPPGRTGFFEAGGGSYDAIRLLSLLRTKFGYHVAFGDFMADPTVAGLASQCRLARPADESGIWVHQPRTCASPRLRLVLFPPVGGGVSCYSGLIRDLPGDVEVHVIGFDRPGPTETLADLAHQCLDRLPANGLQLVFAGWSFGGALAFEAARVCEQPVARVVVVDTPVTSRGTAEPSLAEFAQDIRETTGAVVDEADLPADPALADRFAVYRRNLTLLRKWTPEPLAVPVVEFRADEDPAEPDVEAWGRLAPVDDVKVLAGGHYAVFDGENAHRVRSAIEEVG